jgi:hypothetical protein
VPTGFGNPGQQTGPAQMINNLLTQPRPGGAPGGVNTPGMGGSIVGGLAGVASNFKGRGIKRVNEQEEYQKWEFYYDFGQEMRGANTGIGANAIQLQNQGQTPAAAPGSAFPGQTQAPGNAFPGQFPTPVNTNPVQGVPLQRPK